MFLDSFDGLCYVYLSSFHSFAVLSVLSVLNWGVLDVWTALTALIGGFLVVFMIRYVDSVGQISREFDI